MAFTKPVIFTEYGYPSFATAASKPWQDAPHDPNFEDIQALLYRSLYERFWTEEWFAGGFVWKWKYTGEGQSTGYSPQGKQAEAVLKKWYAQ